MNNKNTKISKHEKLRMALNEMAQKGISNYMVAKNTKISEPTIGDIVNGNTKNPGERTVDLIYNFVINGVSNIEHPPPEKQEKLNEKDKTIQNLAEALLKANSSNEKLVEQNGKVLDRILLSLDALVQASSGGPRIGVGLKAALDQVLGNKEPQMKEQSPDTQMDTSQNKDS